MREFWRNAWERTQEHPFEVSTCWIAVFIGCGRLLYDPSQTSGFAWWLWTTLILGGGITLTGYLRREISLESMGVALMVGGFLFTLIRQAVDAESVVQLLVTVFIYSAIELGFLVRLIVLRKAVHVLERSNT